MLRLRLQRRGKKNYATYRVVVADKRAPVKGRSVADLGSYNPHTDAFNVDGDKVATWLGNGAQPSATVHNLLVTHGVIKADKVTSWRPKVKKEEEKTEAAPAAAKKESGDTVDKATKGNGEKIEKAAEEKSEKTKKTEATKTNASEQKKPESEGDKTE